MTVVLEARGITKQFPGVLANDHVDFTLERGEIHCLLGENGAGKTTLMNVLYGLYHPDAGEVRVNNTPVKLHDANDSIRLGIGMVHQHFMLIPVFTVAENVMLGIEVVRGGRLDNTTVARRITDLSQQYGLRVNPDDYIKDLPVGVQQRVEILKVLYRHAEILILDELFAIMRSLAQQGKSIIFITHKLREVFAVADRISVMRGGKLVGTVLPKDATPERLAELMVGRKVILQVEKREKEAGAPALAVTDLTVRDDRGVVAVHHVSFEVRGGEILGIAGVQGNGQTELAEALTHLRPISGGHIALLGHDISRATP
ncbi:MAG: ATP-binding cassette domain-containing protein, partial [Chloroflexota bacterium]